MEKSVFQICVSAANSQPYLNARKCTPKIKQSLHVKSVNGYLLDVISSTELIYYERNGYCISEIF